MGVPVVCRVGSRFSTGGPGRNRSGVSAHLKPRKSGRASLWLFFVFVFLKKREWLWTLVGISRSSARFPSSGGRVLCVHGCVSVHSLFGLSDRTRVA
jgi:hypothetical protein